MLGALHTLRDAKTGDREDMSLLQLDDDGPGERLVAQLTLNSKPGASGSGSVHASSWCRRYMRICKAHRSTAVSLRIGKNLFRSSFSCPTAKS